MPSYWSAKDERQYQAIKSSCDVTKRSKGRTGKDCERMAAATVNAQRRREGRTLSATRVEKKRVCMHPWSYAIGALGLIIGGFIVGDLTYEG